jgi:small subunit ribosomal protein S9|tara:strand:- start:1817 stop:2212 length:396 start_codon:yes stop_codon:yes gene_type:complete
LKKQTYFQKTGRRKEATAAVRLVPGAGTITINGVPFEERFPRLAHRITVTRPLVVTENVDKYNITVKVLGGGITGQSSAISLGIARSLVASDENLKPILRKNGLLTRDCRIKERKKPGLKRARKVAQSPKR